MGLTRWEARRIIVASMSGSCRGRRRESMNEGSDAVVACMDSASAWTPGDVATGARFPNDVGSSDPNSSSTTGSDPNSSSTTGSGTSETNPSSLIFSSATRLEVV